MTSICEQAAIDSAFIRHESQALALVANSKVNLVVGVKPLRAITGGGDSMTSPGPRHPASRALSAGRDRDA